MLSIRRATALLFCAGVIAASQPGIAQQTASATPQNASAPRVPLMPSGTPVAPTGLQDQPLREGPFVYKTAEGQDIRVTVVARGLEYPYSMAFLPSGELLVTERAGRLRIVRNGVLDPKPIANTPASRYAGKSGSIGAVHGYMSLVVHPRFSENHFIYFAYNKILDEKRTTISVMRARLEKGALTDTKDVFVGENLRGTVALAITPDNMLWMATGGEGAQDPNTLVGKVLRLRDDGTVPPDNPFAVKDGHRPEIYSMGHRAALGLTVNPGTNEVWLSEMGPNGGDEINVIRPGKNYGWPLVSLGRTYPGPWQAKSNEPTHQGYEPPVIFWMPAISVSGLTFYTGDRFPKWKGDLFVGGLRYGEVPGTGRLDRVLFNDKLEELRRESLLLDLHQRIRDVKQGPDGLLYVATDEVQGAILRIEPAS
jgi:glucose/arabinose dehydrogenase